MIYYLIDGLALKYPDLNALTYLSSRIILALLTSIFLSMFIYPRFIGLLKNFNVKQPLRKLGLQKEEEKNSTPTMGGSVIVFTTLISAFLWMDFINPHFVTVLIVTLGFWGVGFLDDFLKISKKNPDGLSGRLKLLLLTFFAIIAVIWHAWSQSEFYPMHSQKFLYSITIPFLKGISFYIGYVYLFFAVLVIVGSSNAVNLTDGLDGLAIGPVITCCLALLILSYVTGNAVVAKYLYYYTVPGSGELCIFLSALIGASVGFLWFNTFPAQIFMGDSGSLALGGILGTVSIITHHEILLIILGGIFVIETLSVIIQVISFKMTGHRVFRMAPLHHHYQKKGWVEQKIVVRVWIISFMLALVSILTLKLR